MATLKRSTLVSTVVVLLGVSAAWYVSNSNVLKAPAAPQKVESRHDDKIMATLKILQNDVSVTSIQKSDIAGLYSVELASGRPLYATEDGAYIFAGNLFKNVDGAIVNVTDEAQKKVAVQKLKGLKESDMVIYPAANRKATITVFTDVDCPYCAKLHDDVPALNAQGIEVRYLAFPRMGLESETYQKMVSVWCAPDARKAMDDATGETPIAKLTCDNQVAAQYELGKLLGVRGTPTIYLESGEMMGGYSPPDRLVPKALAGKAQ
ncbi:DsbC family protein [Pseudomonas serbica]|jgi:thiol:disulfide interchange protein DsbC|uniref:DsbC family protein n=1 Tax=Pseudomonas serbica TaxID=2965074 RepID=UPI00237B9096|nr:DsbC family protein [Pseudomonas serbica]